MENNFYYNERLNSIIENLYNDDIPLHSRIINFFNMLMEELYFDKATLLFFRKDQDGGYSKHSSISVNWSNENIKAYTSYFCHVDDTLPVLDSTVPVIFRSNVFFNKDKRMENPYYRDYLLPNNCPYSIEGSLFIRKNPDLKGAFCYFRGSEKNDFSESEEKIARIFQPHLSNVLKNYGLDNSSVDTFMLDDSNYFGIAIFDSNFKIIRCSETFEQFIKMDNKNEDNRIDIVNQAVKLCRSLRDSKDSAKQIRGEYKMSDAPFFFEVSKEQKKDSSEVQYCCIIYNLSRFFLSTLSQAKKEYGLTSREFNVLVDSFRGLSNNEIAKDLYVSVPTVKKYLTSIYSKMEIENQKQIFEKLKII